MMRDSFMIPNICGYGTFNTLTLDNIGGFLALHYDNAIHTNNRPFLNNGNCYIPMPLVDFHGQLVLNALCINKKSSLFQNWCHLKI